MTEQKTSKIPLRKISLQTIINVPPEIVWRVLVEKKPYEAWTKVFNETSTFVGNWEKGTEIHFIGIGKNGQKEGIVSEVAENIPYQLLSVKHVGMYVGGKPTRNAQTLGWGDVYENYHLKKLPDSKTEFQVELDIDADWYDMMLAGWQKALPLLKQVAEELED